MIKIIQLYVFNPNFKYIFIYVNATFLFCYIRYLETEIIDGKLVYAGKDRYNGEIVAFYISLILGFPRVPIAVKRILDSSELHQTANIGLKKTMYINCKLPTTLLFSIKNYNFVCNDVIICIK